MNTAAGETRKDPWCGFSLIDSANTDTTAATIMHTESVSLCLIQYTILAFGLGSAEVGRSLREKIL
jgi:hypothetical protein